MIAGLLLLTFAGALNAAESKTVVLIDTSLGKIKVELYADKAPGTVKNFVGYVHDKFYYGTLIHRVAKAPTVIQGGGFEPGMKEKKTKAPIKNEAGNGLSNKPYTIAMARTMDADSATAQFFINVRDNDFLDKARDPDNVGYCVFGKVIEGAEVVDRIWNVKTNNEEVPRTEILIKSVRVVEP